MASAGSSDLRAAAFVAASVPENYERRLAPVIFEPWAEILIDVIDVRAGDRVLDVASGTGVVARLAARRAGSEGRVVASDLSSAMLAHAATRGGGSDAALIEYLEASATDLKVADGTFDVVVCQQGLPFFTDRPGAAAEMRRALRAGGVVGLAVWAQGHRLEPFDDYAEALTAAGVEPPFPRAYETSSFVMGADEVEALLTGVGFTSVKVSIVEHTIVWPNSESATAGILGTPFGPVIQSLPTDRREALEGELARRFATTPGEPVRRSTTAIVARAVA
ncbi:MAG: class I SAM-dependent methyltransferase [Actinomycetota bacterium]|nr:class I SAM-dependent methyltransferase [Actinomycetota bacterium]